MLPQWGLPYLELRNADGKDSVAQFLAHKEAKDLKDKNIIKTEKLTLP